jgi:hypothetical protein
LMFSMAGNISSIGSLKATDLAFGNTTSGLC